jgi:hypothetical protein
MRYRLRTLLIVLALGPPVLAGIMRLSESFRGPEFNCGHSQPLAVEWAEAVRQAKAVADYD